MPTCLWCQNVELEGHDLCKECRSLISAISQGIDENRRLQKAFGEFVEVLADEGYVTIKNRKHKHVNVNLNIREPQEKEITDPLRGRRPWKPPYDPNNPFRL